MEQEKTEIESLSERLKEIKAEQNATQLIERGVGFRRFQNQETGEIRTEYDTTQTGTAMRMLDKYGDIMRYNADCKKWKLFNGVTWEEVNQEDKRIMDKLDNVLLDLINSPIKARIDLDESEKKKAEGKERNERQKQTEQRAKSAVLTLCHSYMSDAGIKYDSHPYLFACLNGVFDFEHDEFIYKGDDRLKGFNLTQSAPFEYNPSDSNAVHFKQLLTSISKNDEDIQTDILKACAPLFIGENLTQQFILLHGNPRNGKSTLLNAIFSLLGSYAMGFQNDLFSIKKFSSNHQAEFTALDGKRASLGSEIDSENPLDIEKLKNVTGGDIMTMRGIREQARDYKLQCNFLVAVNNPPYIPHIDTAVKERLKFIPALGNTVPESSRDAGLSDKIEKETPAIFNLIRPYVVQLVREKKMIYSEKTQKYTTQIINNMDWFESFYSSTMFPMMEREHAYYIQPSYIVEYYDAFKTYVNDEYNTNPSNKATFKKKIREVMNHNGWIEMDDSNKYTIKPTDKTDMTYNEYHVTITSKRIKCLFNQPLANEYYKAQRNKLNNKDYHTQYKQLDIEELDRAIKEEF